METKKYGDYARDVAAEGISYLWVEKIMQKNAQPASADKKRLCKEVSILAHERDIVYGRGTPEEYDAVMQKIDNVYAPMIKDAVTNNTSIGNLPTE
jgi:hypothetical protein